MGIILKENSVISYNNDDSMERIRLEKEYLNYIIEHINFVKQAYVMYMVPLLEKNTISHLLSDKEIKDAIEELSLYIEQHDASKFSDAEFDGYRQKYYPTKAEKNCTKEEQQIIDDRYNECWVHHYTVNDHHPKHWVDSDTNVPRDMTLRAIIEMICDWEAMSLKFKSNTLEWYTNDAEDEKSAMTDNTKKIVEELLFNVIHNS